jgi:hypothetical protein
LRIRRREEAKERMFRKSVDGSKGNRKQEKEQEKEKMAYHQRFQSPRSSRATSCTSPLTDCTQTSPSYSNPAIPLLVPPPIDILEHEESGEEKDEERRRKMKKMKEEERGRKKKKT